MKLTAGRLIGHYKVLSPLGAGGMGEVYLAEDVKLGRRAALKLLPAEYTRDEDRLCRFEQEARAASALNHPNIVTIYEIGETDSAHFIATEFIEGETLRRRLAQTRMTTVDLLDVAIQVCNALAAAHQAGIIHRDIKPENLMLRPDGYVKVLDFGVAKLTEKFSELSEQPAEQSEGDRAADSATSFLVQTDPGTVVGSPNYMSPEQARGLSVDGRTDIFSLGAVVYEMIAGRKAFEGASLAEVIVALLEKDPPRLKLYAPDIPERLEQTVAKALSKDRENRHQTINDLLIEFRRQKQRLDFEAGLETSATSDMSHGSMADTRSQPPPRLTVKESAALSGAITRARVTSAGVRSGSPDSSRNLLLFVAALLVAVSALAYIARGHKQNPIDSLAVLPFVNTANDLNAEYLSDGLTESLINNLSQSLDLKVMSRNSVFRYKGQDAEARTVGRELGVRAVMTGRIVQRGDGLDISVELVKADDNSQIWGERYNRKLIDLLSVQDDIARQISEKLRLRLTGDEAKRLTKRYTESTEAYQLYLRGRYYWNKRTEDAIRKSIDYLKQAIAKDPEYALAYAGLAESFASLGEYNPARMAEALPLAKEAAVRAAELDDSLAEAHNSLAAISEYEWNWKEAEQEYRRAIELNPNYATAHGWYAAFLSGRERAAEALPEIHRALELDPLSLILNTSLGRILYTARNYDAAIDQLKKTLDLEDFAEAHFQIGLAYEAKGLYDQASASMQKSIELNQDRTMVGWLGRIYALSGRRSEAQKVLAQLQSMAKQSYVLPYMPASIYAALGDNDQALAWLQKVYDERSYYVVWLRVDPVFDSLRSDPRFRDLLSRIGLTG